MKALNQLRRDALEELTESLLKKYRRMEPDREEILANEKENIHPIEKEKDDSTCIVASIEKRTQLQPLLESEMITDVYLDSTCYTRKTLIEGLQEDCNLLKVANKKVFFVLPAIFRKHTSDFYKGIATELQNLPLDGIIIKNYDALWFAKQYLTGKELIIDHNLYSYNNKAIEELMKFSPVRITALLELNKKELYCRNNVSSELLIYGRLPLMTSAQCIKKSTGGCNKTSGISYIKDRYNVIFPIKNNCEECYNVLYNALPVLLFGQAEEVKKMQFVAYRLSFTTEDEKEVRKILDVCNKTFVTASKNIKDIYSEEFTYGHYKRGVE